MSRPVNVSVVATVRNEFPNVVIWLEGLLNQTRVPDEIVVVDGGSTDGTFEAIERRSPRSEVPIVVLSLPGANISTGRNRAIERSTGSIVAVTDAGTVADADWLERIIAPLVRCEADVASGFFTPRLDSIWERALAATTLPDSGEIDAETFLPSSRSMAFRREWFDIGIRYPEWLDYCEDLVWDLAMRRAGACFTFVPDARVTFAVRPTLRSFALQYVRYARGDGKAGLFARRHLLRYVTYGCLVAILARRRPRELVLAGILGSAYVKRSLLRLQARNLAEGRAATDLIVAAPLSIALRGVGDIAKMVGYPAGLWWRWRRFGSLGWRTAWPRVSPAGEVFRPATSTRENQPPSASHVAGSRVGRR